MTPINIQRLSNRYIEHIPLAIIRVPTAVSNCIRIACIAGSSVCIQMFIPKSVFNTTSISVIE